MSIFDSHFCKCGSKQVVDVALDTLNNEFLRISCCTCDKEIPLKLTKAQGKLLYHFWRD